MAEFEEKKRAVEIVLERENITFEAVFVRTHNAGRTEQMDEFECSFSSKKFAFTTQYRSGSGHRTKIKKHGRKPEFIVKLPHVSDVCHCLILDASDAGEYFIDWCDNFCEPIDSRKALDTYLACQKTAVDLRKLISADARKELETIFQDW